MLSGGGAPWSDTFSTVTPIGSSATIFFQVSSRTAFFGSGRTVFRTVDRAVLAAFVAAFLAVFFADLPACRTSFCAECRAEVSADFRVDGRLGCGGAFLGAL